MPGTREMEPVPACRVLMRGGVPCNELITERARLDDCRAGLDLHSEPQSVYVPPARAIHCKPGRPRTAPAKLQPHAGQGKGWNRLSVTAAEIRLLREQGLTLMEIAKRLGCSYATVHGRLKERG